MGFETDEGQEITRKQHLRESNQKKRRIFFLIKAKLDV